MGEHNLSKLAAAGAIFASLVSCAGAPPSPLIAAISVSAPGTRLELATSEQLSVQVSGAGGDSVFWKIVEGDRGGSINASGLYVAPPRAGLFHVVAISAVDLSMSATIAIEVSAPPLLQDRSIQLEQHAELTSNWPRSARL